MGLPAASGSPGTNRLGSLRLFALCCFPRPRPASWPAWGSPVPRHAPGGATGARGRRGVQEERGSAGLGRDRGCAGALGKRGSPRAVAALSGRVGAGSAGGVRWRGGRGACAALPWCGTSPLVERERDLAGSSGHGAHAVLPAAGAGTGLGLSPRRAAAVCAMGRSGWRWREQLPAAAGSSGGSVELDVPAPGWPCGISPRCWDGLVWLRRSIAVVAGSGPGGCVELGEVSGSLWHGPAQEGPGGSAGPAASAQGRRCQVGALDAVLGTHRRRGAAEQAGSVLRRRVRVFGCRAVRRVRGWRCACRGGTCLSPNLRVRLRPRVPPCAAARSAGDGSGAANAGGRRLFRGRRDPILPLPGPAWPRAMPCSPCCSSSPFPSSLCLPRTPVLPAKRLSTRS